VPPRNVIFDITFPGPTMILKVTSFLLVLTVSQGKSFDILGFLTSKITVIADFVRPFELGARQLAAVSSNHWEGFVHGFMTLYQCPEVNCTSIAPVSYLRRPSNPSKIDGLP